MRLKNIVKKRTEKCIHKNKQQLVLLCQQRVTNLKHLSKLVSVHFNPGYWSLGDILLTFVKPGLHTKSLPHIDFRIGNKFFWGMHFFSWAKERKNVALLTQHSNKSLTYLPTAICRSYFYICCFSQQLLLAKDRGTPEHHISEASCGCLQYQKKPSWRSTNLSDKFLWITCLIVYLAFQLLVSISHNDLFLNTS